MVVSSHSSRVLGVFYLWAFLNPAQIFSLCLPESDSECVDMDPSHMDRRSWIVSSCDVFRYARNDRDPSISMVYCSIELPFPCAWARLCKQSHQLPMPTQKAKARIVWHIWSWRSSESMYNVQCRIEGFPSSKLEKESCSRHSKEIKPGGQFKVSVHLQTPVPGRAWCEEDYKGFRIQRTNWWEVASCCATCLGRTHRRQSTSWAECWRRKQVAYQ